MHKLRVNWKVAVGFLFTLSAGIVHCDTLALRNGQILKGSLLEANGRQIRFAVGDVVQVYPITEVLNISFEDSNSANTSVISPAVSPSHSTAMVETHSPATEAEFCSLVDDFRRSQLSYSQETNPIRKAGMAAPNPMQYEARVKEIFGNHHEFTDWRGIIRVGVSGQSVSVTFTPDCGSQSQIQFSNAVPPPMIGHGAGLPPEDMRTVISLHSRLAETLKNVHGTQLAIVSGTLIPFSGLTRLNAALSPNRVTAPQYTFKGHVGYQGASVASPNYLVQFTSITLHAMSQ